jgi:hypothetical protein
MVHGEMVNYNLEEDEIIASINEPTFMTDRKREELRMTKDGIYYLHTDNDRENEQIITAKFEIDIWLQENDITI